MNLLGKQYVVLATRLTVDTAFFNDQLVSVLCGNTGKWNSIMATACGWEFSLYFHHA